MNVALAFAAKSSSILRRMYSFVDRLEPAPGDFDPAYKIPSNLANPKDS